MDLRTIKVATLGSPASFHDIAARRCFGPPAEIIPSNSFAEVCLKLSSNQCDYAVIAAGNSIAGIILGNYSLVLQHSLHVIAEHYMKIELHLMALKGSRPEEIRYIRSHPMALKQCNEFLATLPAELIQEADTASSVKAISARGKKDTAAIAGLEAAERYGLEIIARNIHSMEQNYTRFWILSKGQDPKSEANKATLAFELPDLAGSLAEALQVFKQEGLSLSSIQSLPLPEASGMYRFYADLEYDTKEKYERCLKALSFKCSSIQIMGNYRKDLIPNNSISSNGHS